MKDLLVRVRETLAPVVGRVRELGERLFGTLTPLGVFVGLTGLGAWLIGAMFDWAELLTIAAGGLLAVGAGLLWTIRKPELRVEATLVEPRVTVGQEAVGRVHAVNRGQRRIGSTRVDVPVGAGLASFMSPALGAGEPWEETYVIPTERRAVIPVGPASAVNADPIGISRRAVSQGEAQPLYVHPHTVKLPPLAAGWLRDLEGQQTNDLSNSDVAFHTLREYVPGDDRRHVHWRSSARVGKLMVRQFVDTRRTHLGLMLATLPRHWADDEEFEFGIQVLGSIGRTALGEGQTVGAVAGSRLVHAETGSRLLDGLAGVELEPEGPGLAEVIRLTSRSLRGISLAVAVVGSPVEVGRLRRHAERFSSEVNLLVIQCGGDKEPRRRKMGRMTLIEVADLPSLSRIMLAGAMN